jgi:uncharacterized membrane protein
MERVKKTIEVDRPPNQVYNQWTQFEEFPRFMEGVKEVRQLDDKRLHWRAEIAGKEKKWIARIIEQIPDDRIAWESESGEYTSGRVDFARLGTDRTRVALEISYDPQGFMKTLATRWAWFPDALRMMWSTSKNSSKTAVKKRERGVGRFGKAANRCLSWSVRQSLDE